MRIAEVIGICRRLAPPGLALEHDRIGLQVGDHAAKVRGILLTLDVTHAAIAAAARAKCNLIIAHHPLIYSPLKTIVAGNRAADLVSELIRRDMALFVMHTNYDAVAGGMNDVLAAKIGLRDIVPLLGQTGSMVKFVVFVPVSHAARVRTAIGAAGGGRYGNYAQCTFSAPGTGTFQPLDGSRPFIGTRGRTEEVAELRIEAIVPQATVGEVIAAARRAHPYEEMAYDVYPLVTPGFTSGIGTRGRLAAPQTLAQFAARVKRALKVPRVHLVGKPKQKVRMVAVCAGSATDLIPEVLQAGADVFLTGELKHAAYLEAEHAGLAVVAAGHFPTERIFIRAVAARLRPQLPGAVCLVADSPVPPDTIV